MLTYINCNIENNPYSTCIELSFTPKGIVSSVDFDKVIISRRRHGFSGWEEMSEISISGVGDLTFTVLDNLSKCGEVYDYMVETRSGTTVKEFQIYSEGYECWFNGLYIGDLYDANKQYVAVANFNTTIKRNIEVEYVTTLANKYPFRISNADTNYTTGDSEGLFLKLTENKKKFIPDSYHSYTKEVVDFLTDGNTKILRTHDGQAYCISVDDTVDERHDNFEGDYVISFSWTEIDDLPEMGMVVSR